MTHKTLFFRFLAFLLVDLCVLANAAGSECEPRLDMLDVLGHDAVSNLVDATTARLSLPGGTNAVLTLSELLSAYDSPTNRGFRPLECKMWIQRFVRNDRTRNAALLHTIFSSIGRHSPDVQRDLFWTFVDLWVKDMTIVAGRESLEVRRTRDGIDDMAALLWWMARSEAIAPEIRRHAWIWLGDLVQRGDPSAAPFAAGLKAADEAIAEAEREAERERRLRTESIPVPPSRPNAAPIPVDVKVRRNRNPATTTDIPPGFPSP